MRMILAPTLAVLLVGANGPAETIEAPRAFDNPAYSEPTKRWKSAENVAAEKGINIPAQDMQSCRDQIVLAEGEGDQNHQFERESASPEKPMLIYAVDMQQDGCSVMLMKDGTNDVRPLPLPSKEPLQIIPADADE